MRELLFKNYISKDRKRTQIFLSEHFERNGVVQDLEKRIKYRIKDVLEFTDTFDLELFLDKKSKEESSVRTFIIRNQNTKTGMTKFIYKILGEQYLVLGDKILVLEISQYIKRIITANEPEIIFDE